MMNIAARYLRPATHSAAGAAVDADAPPAAPDIPPDLQEQLRGHKVVAYPPSSPVRGRSTQAPDSSSPRPRSLSESRKATRTKDLVKDVYERMGIAYDKELGGADLSKPRHGRSRQVEDSSSERSRPRSLSKGRIASIWPPQPAQNNLDNASWPSPTSSQQQVVVVSSPTKKTMEAATALAFQKTKPATLPFGSPAYCKDMHTLMPSNVHKGEGSTEGSISPTSTATQKTDGCSETDAEKSVGGGTELKQTAPKRFSVRDHVKSLGGNVKEPPTTTSNILSRNIDAKKYAVKLKTGDSYRHKSAPSLSMEEKKDDDIINEVDSVMGDVSSPRSATGNVTRAVQSRKVNSYIPTTTKQSNFPTGSSKRQTSIISAFRGPGHAATTEFRSMPALGFSSSSSDYDANTKRTSWNERNSVLGKHTSLSDGALYGNEDIDRLIDERVQAHVAVIEARMESQLGQYMEEMDRKMKLMQTQLTELQSAKIMSRARP